MVKFLRNLALQGIATSTFFLSQTVRIAFQIAPALQGIATRSPGSFGGESICSKQPRLYRGLRLYYAMNIIYCRVVPNSPGFIGDCDSGKIVTRRKFRRFQIAPALQGIATHFSLLHIGKSLFQIAPALQGIATQGPHVR